MRKSRPKRLIDHREIFGACATGSWDTFATRGIRPKCNWKCDRGPATAVGPMIARNRIILYSIETRGREECCMEMFGGGA
jgi:hypothetical protein